MGLEDFEGGKKYKVMMLVAVLCIFIGCILGPFIDYEIYLFCFLCLTGGSLIQLLLFAIASIRTTFDSLKVLERVNSGKHHNFIHRHDLRHVIVFPIYL